MDSGVARKPLADIDAYRTGLQGRLDPTAAYLQLAFAQVRSGGKRVVFAEGEEERTIRAALAFRDAGYGTPVLIGREERITAMAQSMGIARAGRFEIHNAALSQANVTYTDFLYARLQRKGALYRDCQRMVNQDRNIFAACMVSCGDADAMVTGVTRNYFTAFEEVTRVIGPKPGQRDLRLCLADHARPLGARFRHHRASDAVGRRARRYRDAIGGAGEADDGPDAARRAPVLLEFRQSESDRCRPRA